MFGSNSRIIGLIILLVIIGSVCWVKPWLGGRGRTIAVTGEGTVTAVPDEYQFNVTYEKTATTEKTANSDVAAIGNEVVTQLKSLGVDEKEIKTSLANHPLLEVQPSSSNKDKTFTSSYTITILAKNKEQAQKIQDYLATTDAQYNYSPNPMFSKEMQDKLEEEARTKALDDAKKKAEKTAKQLGVKVGKVISVSDVQQTGGPITLARDAAVSSSTEQKLVAPTVEAGSQDLTFSVTVTYQIK